VRRHCCLVLFLLYLRKQRSRRAPRGRRRRPSQVKHTSNVREEEGSKSGHWCWGKLDEYVMIGRGSRVCEILGTSGRRERGFSSCGAREREFCLWVVRARILFVGAPKYNGTRFGAPSLDQDRVWAATRTNDP
jgi:hypothetical protein